tara:strand:- start:799 stop:1152 length:354 start_codon:yes stop_codon:yes gene_type:complete
MYSDYEHQRAIPRDLFNEAKLLKCWGNLSLKIHDNLSPVPMRIEWDNQPFDIKYDIDGDTYIANMKLYVNDQIQEVRCLMNSKDNYPMIFQNNLEYVFDNMGNFNENITNPNFFEND